MKKISIVLITLLLITTMTYSQGFRFGIKGSTNMAWMKPDVSFKESTLIKTIQQFQDVDNYKKAGMVMRFSYGLVGEIAISDNYSFVTGLNIAYCGGKLEFPHTEEYDTIPIVGIVKREFNMQHIELPLMLKMKTNEIGGFTYYVQFGFGTGILIGSKGTDEFTTAAKVLTVEDIDLIEEKKVRFLKEALLIGAGFEYSLSDNVSAIVGITFNNGFSNVMRGTNELDDEVKEKAIANYVEINLGFLF